MDTTQVTTQSDNTALNALKERINEVQDNINAVDNFQLPKVKLGSDGFEITDGEDTLDDIEGTLVHLRKVNIYYEKPYQPGNEEPPTCFSPDGVTPDHTIALPVNPTCKGCPKSEYGTSPLGTGKACRNMRLVYLLMTDEAIIPRVLTVPPTSLRAVDKYLMDLTERGLNFRKVKTKIHAYKEDKKATYCKLKFSMAEKLSKERSFEVETIRTQLLPVLNGHSMDAAESGSEAF